MTAACPACLEVPQNDGPLAPAPLEFSLPGIHCAACIGTIERGLAEMRGLQSARVNLSMKRLAVHGPVEPQAVLDRVAALGFEIYPLDRAALEGEKDAEGRGLLLRMAVAGFAMMNVMLLSVGVWSGAEAATRDLFHLISGLIAVPVIAYSGQPFFRKAVQALRVGRLNMDVPISLALVLAVGMSTFESLQGGVHAYFDAALSLTFFLLIGRYLDHQGRSAARSAAKELAALEVHTCDRLDGAGRTHRVATTDVAPGDRLLIPSGARIPVDGQLETPEALLDRSFLTGESAAIGLRAGASLQAGEINLGAPLTLRATAVGADTTLRRIAQMVETAETGRNSYTALADRAAAIYAPLVHLLAALAFAGWWAWGGDLRQAANIAIAVLIITCPCALGLAVPAVSTAAVGRLFGAGFLVKHATALERLAEVDHVIFDKTGTLSSPSVLVPGSLSGTERGVLLALAQQSAHPLSRAVVAALEGVRPEPIDQATEHPGQGVQAVWRGQPVALGHGRWLDAGFQGLGLRLGQAVTELPSVEVLAAGGAGALEALDVPAEVMTGDTVEAARAFSAASGLPVTGRATPEDKIARITALDRDGRRVLMVGDGLNDTGALARAHASLAPATALDASRAAADVVLLKANLADLPLLLAVARAVRRLSTQNFAIAAAYNAIAIPVALAGFATPLAAAIAMSASSITVLLNAQRVRFAQ